MNLAPMRRLLATLFLWLALWAPAAQAQELQPLPVSGGMSWNVIFHEAAPEGHRTLGATRFSGRLAVRLSENAYLGFSVGSWAREGRYIAPQIPVDVIASRSEAALHSVYAQVYGRAFGLCPFLRGGIGLARTETFLPAGGMIDRLAHWRGQLGVGTGLEVHLGGNMYLSPSVDFGAILGVDHEAGELRRALSVGIGLILR